MSKELKTTQSNDAIQFVQGISSKNLDNVAITPGTVYFFDDGSIIWDHETNGENKRSTMSGQTFVYSAGQSYTETQLKNNQYNSLYTIPQSNSANALYDTPWTEGQSNWIPLATFKEWADHQNVPKISLPKIGTYDIIIHLQQGVINTINKQDNTPKKIPIENIYYHGTFTLILDDYVNRGCDEILLSRGGGQGMIQSHYLYLRLYGNDSEGYTDAPIQLQIASNANLDITKLSITLRKIH